VPSHAAAETRLAPVLADMDDNEKRVARLAQAMTALPVEDDN
jgi:hypothetical protein